MGCTVSKLDNEDTVRRCKDRRRLIKAAVHARHHLSAAHFDYCRSLRLTGAALSTFGAGEPLSVYDHAPPVLLRTQSSSSAATTATTMRPRTPPYYPPTVPSPSPSTPPPPPPAASVGGGAATYQQHRRKKSMKLPHILSDSSFTSSPKPPQMDYTYNAKANSTYSATPSQASSVWNWENFYPPSPPDSDYFEQLKSKNNPLPNATSRSHYGEDEDEEDKQSRYSAYSRKDKSQINQHQNASRIPPPKSTTRSHYDEDEEEEKRSRFSAYSGKNESHQHQRQSSTGFPAPNPTSRTRSQYDEDEEEDKRSRYSAYSRKEESQSHHNQRQNNSGFPNPNATSRRPYDEDEEEEKMSRYSTYSRKEESHHNQPQTTGGFDFFNDDKLSNYSSYSNHSLRNAKNSQWNQGGNRKNNEELRHLNRSDSGEEDVETEREEVQCSEWGDHDHYSTTSSSSDEEHESRSGISRGSNFRSKTEGFDTASDISKAKSTGEKIGLGNSSKSFRKGASDFHGKAEKLYSDDGRSTASWGNRGRGDYEMVSDTRIVVRHKDLAEIVTAIKEYFDKAASSGDQVSAMLETGRGQLDQSFSNLKKTVYHSSGVFSNLSSSWTSKPPLAVKYKFEPSSLEVSGGPKSLGSTLERLLAWEKKLYEEVKAREGVKIEHEKKLASLQSQEYKGDEDAKLDKTKASIKRLQSLIVVTSQAVSTTSAAIIDQRDSELVPQLVELCHGFMYMWRSMNQFHQVQNDIVQQVRSLVNLSAKGESTSDLHRQATRDLESAVSSWHSSFCRLIKFKRDFICSVHGWFKLSLIPINAEEATNGSKIDSSEAFAFSDEWKLALDRVPDTVASEAIKSFINVVHSISLKQTEELKIKKRTESASKELEKKAASLRNIEKKYYNSYSLVGIGLPDIGPDNGHALDARDPLAEKKLELSACQRRVEDEMVKHSKAVEVTRAMTLNNIQTGLPGVFQAMTSFSALFTEALEVVCTRSYAIK